MLLVVLANNLGVMWIAVEATALSSVLLVALYNRKTSLEAAWKYVILGGLGLVLALFGTIFTYAAAIGKTGGGKVSRFHLSRLLAQAPPPPPPPLPPPPFFLPGGLRPHARPPPPPTRPPPP